MNYYERHIGDYLKDTAHLSLLEHGIYSRLLDVYYTRESPIPSSIVARLTGVRSKEERQALQAVLQEFFSLVEGEEWAHPRCDREIARYKDKQAKAKRSADARWSNPDRNASVMRTHSDGNAPQAPSTKHQAPKREEKKEDEPPHGEIIQVFGEELPMARQPRGWNDARKALLRARWFEDEKRQTVDWWREFFRYIAKSDFLCGRNNTPGRAPFVLSLDWLCNSTNFLKVLEGSYES